MDFTTSPGSSAERRKTIFSAPAWLLPKLLAWFGASTGALTAVCTVFGYLVEHSYLSQLGVPRTVYEATPREYVVSGAQFVASLIPLSALGSGLFIFHYWWVVLLSAVFAVAAWRRRLSSHARLLFAVALYTSWVIAMALRFETANPPDEQGLAMFTFGTVAAFLYCTGELCVATQLNEERRPTLELFAKLLLYALLFCSVFALPIIKGIHGTVRENPHIEFLGKDRQLLCALVGIESDASGPDCGPWQLIEFGKDRTLLRRTGDRSVYVVQSSSVTTFRLLPYRTTK
jgi:hypothetical protein